MAEIKNGILGSFTGKVGPVSGYTRYGRNIMRSSSSTVNDKITPKRAAQREKVRVCNAFINAFSGTGIFAITFPDPYHGGSGYNRAMKVLMNSALTGEYPTYGILYDKFLISKGALPAPENAAVSLDEAGNFVFTWTNNSTDGTAKANDKAVMVAWFPEKQIKLAYAVNGADRSACTATLAVSIDNKGATAETWIGFVSADGKIASDSVHTGSLVA
ncbi:MAG: DUF6266 family protein [Ginsengibacter sp.]